jgi:predicted nuclease of restriction endonuclease-like RecB superfamily
MEGMNYKIEGMNYKELQKEAKRAGVKTFGKTKKEIIELLGSKIEIKKSAQLPEIEIKKPQFPEPQKDFNLMSWEEGTTYIKWVAEEIGYKPREIKDHFRKSGFINYDTKKFDEMYTELNNKKYFNDLFRKKVTNVR